jgi:hypothetical protein
MPSASGCTPAALRRLLLVAAFLTHVVSGRQAIAQVGGGPSPPYIGESVMDSPGLELSVHRIPNIGNAVEFYFSPDGKRIIGDARREGDTAYHVYTLNIDGTDIRRINHLLFPRWQEDHLDLDARSPGVADRKFLRPRGLSAGR